MRGEAPARSTIDATIRPGEVLAAGSLSSYRRLEHGPGEPRELRLELAGEAQAGLSPEVRRQRGAESSIFRLAHVTDLQIVDVASPGRFEFFEELRGSPDAGSFVPAQRPQEAMLPHAIDAMVESLNADGGSPDTGASIDVVVSTGDNIDNAQWNELCWYLSLMAGGEVGRRAAGYEGVQSQSWPPGPYWRPDETEGIFQSLYGFPHAPGLLELAAERFVAAGLRLPWVACFGNHDGLVLGESLATADYRQIVVAGRKALALPEGFDPLCNKQRLFDSPELFLAGPGVEVTPDHDRRVIGRREFVAAHLAAGGLPEGHGFKEENLVAGTAYGSYDLSERVRLLLLDTANLDGHHDGSIGVRQMAWLEERLSECHSRHLAPDGGWQRGSGSDRLVVLASHHGMRTLSNTRQSPAGAEEDHPRVAAAAILSLLCRFPNVVAWLTGHRHVNEIAARQRGPLGLWEIATASIADWPSQGRFIELVDNRDGTLSLLTSMVDHAAAIRPDAAAGRQRLASQHRELAGNVPLVGFGSSFEGSPADRNTELVIPAPFALD